jgi:hypothetical protein
MEILIIIGAVLIVAGMVYLVNATGSITTIIDCNQITYSENWTLSYLRNISRICSDG